MAGSGNAQGSVCVLLHAREAGVHTAARQAPLGRRAGGAELSLPAAWSRYYTYHRGGTRSGQVGPETRAPSGHASRSCSNIYCIIDSHIHRVCVGRTLLAAPRRGVHAKCRETRPGYDGITRKLSHICMIEKGHIMRVLRGPRSCPRCWTAQRQFRGRWRRLSTVCVCWDYAEYVCT